MKMETMTYLLMGLLLLGGYFFLLRAMMNKVQVNISKPVFAVVLLVLYAAIAVPFVMILNQMGSPNFVLLTLLILISCCVLFAALYGMIRNFQDLNKKMLVFFALYMLLLSYVTLFSRSENHSRAILLRIDSLREALSTHSLEPLRHVFLNAIMFIPIGILIPMIYPEEMDRFLYIAPLGMMISVLIEATQMLLRIGQCDVEDIIANTAGAVLGLILFKIFRRFLVREDDEEDEEEYEEDDQEEA